MNVDEFEKLWNNNSLRIKWVKIEDGVIYADSYDITVSKMDNNTRLHLLLSETWVASILLSKVKGVD